MCRFVICANEILENLVRVKGQIKKTTKVCCVVKANAYGFGLAKICNLLKNNVDYFAVARLNEFLEYKALNIEKPCLILSPLCDKSLLLAIKNGAEITVSTNTNIGYIEKVAEEYGVKAKIHIKLDTGMNRYGLKQASQLINLLQNLRTCKNIEVVGCYSHLYEAENLKSIKKQLEMFKVFKKIVESYGHRPIFHISNSMGIKLKENHFDMVRVGIDIYHGLEHKLVTDIVEIKPVKKGETIGYNASFKAKKDMTIAVCSAGYADGISRKLSNKGHVLVKGFECKILGNICMDCFMIDVSKINMVAVGDEVVIWGKSEQMAISICEVAKMCGTIAYEIYTSLSLRVKRVYRWRNYADYHRKIQGKKIG